MSTDSKTELTTAIYDAIAAFNAVACWGTLQHARNRQYLAEHLAGALSAAGWAPGEETLVAEVRRLRAELAGPHAETLRAAGWTECSPAWLAANPGQCATAARIPGGTAVSHWHPQQAEPEAQQPAESCGKCRQPFDPADPRFDGHARHGDTPFCRRCVDACHESTDAFHACAICR
ncbi:hypothetical protein [Streptomyces sp. NPDC002573]|uniref:hypothetical protein n=1 Tax=Streptomyces sp. NPDC002573 TaxID=3364651 RepID=UPI0036AEE323